MKSTAVALLFALLLSLPTYGQTIPVAACGVDLNVEGGKYVLTQDIGPCAGNGVNITANDVKFDLNGFTITGSGGSIGINVIGSGAHISGGTVSRFGRGILINGGSENHVHGMNVTGNRGGIELRSSDNNHINDNTVASNIGGFEEFGIDLISSDNNHLNGNYIDGSFSANVHLFDSHYNLCNGNESVNSIVGDGFELVESDNNVFTSNIAKSNDISGLSVSRSNNNTLRGNMADGNGIVGISVSISSENTVQSNTANGNLFTGIFLGLSDNNTIISNTAAGSFLEDGIALVISSGNLVKSNTALDNAGFDLSDDSCPENIWKNNFFVTSFGPCVE